MAKEDLIELEGIITDAFHGGSFEVTVELKKDGKTMEKKIIANLSGKLRKNHIKILRGDRVVVSVSPYDLTRGIITWRYK